jgi:excisionase family DNA binding protein
VARKDDYMSMTEVAKLIGRTRQGVHWLAQQKRLPHKRVGNFLLFKRRDVQRWIEEHEALAATRVEAA